jgi:hypothetical protein
LVSDILGGAFNRRPIDMALAGRAVQREHKSWFSIGRRRPGREGVPIRIIPGTLRDRRALRAFDKFAGAHIPLQWIVAGHSRSINRASLKSSGQPMI